MIMNANLLRITIMLLLLHGGATSLLNHDGATEDDRATEENDRLFHWNTDGQPIICTFKGSLRGLKEESISGRPFLSFYAIPYAKPPLAELRFQDPIEEEAWTEVRDASSQPEPCMHFSFKMAKRATLSEDNIKGSEDCLYVNVFTPKVDVHEGLPVMVYLHGGGYVGGAANEFEPYVLLDHQVVLVVPQFRLGTLAFLSTEDEVMSGNYMLKDQMAALKWVQHNIQTFGGDPKRVMVFGESAGGMSSSLITLSPRAQGLFSRTALHSGTAVAPFAFGRKHRQVAEETATSFGFSGNLDSRSILSFLQTVSAKSLISVAFKYYKWFTLPNVMGPRVDGDLIPEDPYKLLHKVACPPWELMSGFTAHDGALLTHNFYLRENLRTRLKEKFAEIAPISLSLADDDANALMKATTLYQYYLGENIDIGQSENYTKLMTDYYFRLPNDMVALSHASCLHPHNKTFTFIMSYRGEQSASDKLNITIGKDWVTHLDDLIYLFPVDALLGGAKPLSSPKDLVFREIMTKLWVNFAKTGNPTPDASLGFTWQPVRWNDIKNLKLTLSPVMEVDPHHKVHEFYRRVFPEIDELLKKFEGSGYCKSRSIYDIFQGFI